MADEHDLAKEIGDVLALTEPGALADFSPLIVATKWAEEVSEAAHAAALAYESEDRSQLVAQATKAALEIWDTQVVPQDIPQVPEVIEVWVESSIRGLIPSLVVSLFDRLPKPEAA